MMSVEVAELSQHQGKGILSVNEGRYKDGLIMPR